MEHYRKARQQCIICLATALLLIIGIELPVEWLQPVFKVATTSVSPDLIRMAAVTLTIYGGYHLVVEWNALKAEEQRIGIWHKEYLILRKLVVFVICLAYVVECIDSWSFFHAASSTDFSPMGLVVQSWGAGFIGGGTALLSYHLPKYINSTYIGRELLFLRVSGAILIVGNILMRIHQSQLTGDKLIVLKSICIILWGFSVVGYFILIKFREKLYLFKHSNEIPES